MPKFFGKGGALDKAARNFHKETERVVKNAAESVSNGVPAKELDHVRDRNSDEIKRICKGHEFIDLTKKIALHNDSFLSFFMGEVLNDLTPLLNGETLITHEHAYKTMHMFLTLVDNLHDNPDFAPNIYIDEAINQNHHSSAAEGVVRNLASVKPAKNEDGSFSIKISGYVLEGGILKPGAGADLILRSSQTDISQAEEEKPLDGQEKTALEIATLNSHETRMEELARENAAMEEEIAALRTNAALRSELEELRAGQNASGSLPTYEDTTGSQDGTGQTALAGEISENCEG